MNECMYLCMYACSDSSTAINWPFENPVSLNSSSTRVDPKSPYIQTGYYVCMYVCTVCMYVRMLVLYVTIN